MKCEHDTRTFELPGLPAPAKPATQAQPNGRGSYKAKQYATSWAQRRCAVGLTMKELAKRAGVSLRTLERLEGQSDDVSLQSRHAVRDALALIEATR